MTSAISWASSRPRSSLLCAARIWVRPSVPICSRQTFRRSANQNEPVPEGMGGSVSPAIFTDVKGRHRTAAICSSMCRPFVWGAGSVGEVVFSGDALGLFEGDFIVSELFQHFLPEFGGDSKDLDCPMTAVCYSYLSHKLWGLALSGVLLYNFIEHVKTCV